MEYICLAEKVKVHGIKGEIKVLLQSNEIDHQFAPEALFSAIQIGADENDLSYIPWFVKHFRMIDNNQFIVSFEGVENRSQAEQNFLQSGIYINVDQEISGLYSIESEFNELLKSVVGYQVINQNALLLSVVEDIIFLQEHELIQINYEGEEVLLPCHPDLILNIDHDKKEVQLQIAEGLIDVYLNKANAEEE